MSTWYTGRRLVAEFLEHRAQALDVFLDALKQRPPLRVPGTAVFMTARPGGVPPILVHHLRHNKVLHEQVILLTVSILDAPAVEPDAALSVHELGHGFYRVLARYGYTQPPDVPAAIAGVRALGVPTSSRRIESACRAGATICSCFSHGTRVAPRTFSRFPRTVSSRSGFNWSCDSYLSFVSSGSVVVESGGAVS
jgi:K+ transporter